VHYIPIHYHRYYRETWGYEVGWFPATEKYYAECLSLPIFPAMTESDTQSAIDGVRKVLAAYRA
jgi:dTDP-4-amino-4,6-dideoxygalactose transaminase